MSPTIQALKYDLPSVYKHNILTLGVGKERFYLNTEVLTRSGLRFEAVVFSNFFSFSEGLVTLANNHNYKEILVLMKPHGKIPTDFNT